MKYIGSKMCMTKDVGLNGNMFGGFMLQYMDEFAAIFAHQESKEERMVTLRFGEIIFKKAVKLGNIVEFYTDNVKFGKTSITFDILANVGEEVVFSTDCTFVAVDQDGNKKTLSKN